MAQSSRAPPSTRRAVDEVAGRSGSCLQGRSWCQKRMPIGIGVAERRISMGRISGSGLWVSRSRSCDGYRGVERCRVLCRWFVSHPRG